MLNLIYEVMFLFDVLFSSNQVTVILMLLANEDLALETCLVLVTRNFGILI